MKRIVFNYPSSVLGIERKAGGLICGKRKNSFRNLFLAQIVIKHYNSQLRAVRSPYLFLFFKA